MHDSYPYPYLLGIDWEFNNNVVLNISQWHVSFDIDTFLIIAPLYPNEPMNEDVQSSTIENIYNITRCKENYVNKTTNGKLS